MIFQQTTRKGSFYVVIAVTFLCVLFFEDPMGLFAYQRQEILNGEYWRLITGHLTHQGITHGLLNLFAWLLIWLYGRGTCSTPLWIGALIVCSIGVSFGILLFLPNLQTYTGFSGVLHGVLTVAAILRIYQARQDPTGWIILFFIAGKLIYEALYGPTPTTADLIDMRIITESHLYGAISGVLVCIVFFLVKRIRTIKSPT